MAGSGVAVWVEVGSRVGVRVNVGVGEDGKAVWVGTVVAVGGVGGEGCRAVVDKVGVAAGAADEQAEKSRVARRVNKVRRAKRGPVMALRQGQYKGICIGVVPPEGLWWAGNKEVFPSPQRWIISCHSAKSCRGKVPEFRV
jgi:hypothetical protein